MFEKTNALVGFFLLEGGWWLFWLFIVFFFCLFVVVVFFWFLERTGQGAGRRAVRAGLQAAQPARVGLLRPRVRRHGVGPTRLGGNVSSFSSFLSSVYF